LVIVIALSLGIGANATVFTLTNAVLFKGFPFDKSERILYLQERNVRNDRFAGVSYPDFRDWRAAAKSFEGLSAFTGPQINVGDDTNVSEVYPAAQMTANSFCLATQVSPNDPGTFAGASLALILAAALGCLIPARRASSVDPVVALYHE
jgi:ABC-type antimicrobial peptide transport system permease subunit